MGEALVAGVGVLGAVTPAAATPGPASWRGGAPSTASPAGRWSEPGGGARRQPLCARLMPLAFALASSQYEPEPV